MTGKQRRSERRERQALEVDANQGLLRATIAETERLVDQKDETLKRHRKEREAEEA